MPVPGMDRPLSMKTCKECGFVSFYPREHFYGLKSGKDGLAARCNACVSRKRSPEGRQPVKGFGFLREGMTPSEFSLAKRLQQFKWQQTGIKKCGRCTQLKPADTKNFHRDAKRGLASECKTCASVLRKKEPKRLLCFRGATSKQCPKCREIKVFEEYYLDAKQKDGLYNCCKSCQRTANRDYNARNRDKARDRENRRKDTDPAFLLKCRVLGLVRKSLDRRGRSAEVKSVTSSFWAAVGYSSEQLALHIERQFLPGMTWENRREWHIDHILPVRSFSYESFECPEFKACWALANLRPYWAIENLRKGDRQTLLI